MLAWASRYVFVQAGKERIMVRMRALRKV